MRRNVLKDLEELLKTSKAYSERMYNIFNLENSNKNSFWQKKILGKNTSVKKLLWAKINIQYIKTFYIFYF